VQGATRRFLSPLAGLALGFTGACSSNDSGTIDLNTGEETDTFTRSPTPTKLEVDSIDSTGKSTTLASVAYPANSIDLGSVDPGSSGILQISGFDAAGDRILAGQSIPMVYGWLAGLSLPVFVQRTQEFARLPNPPSDARPSPVVGVVEARYLVVAGGSDATLAPTTLVYDLANLAPVYPAITLPETPKSMAFVGLVGWFFNDSGVSQYDFSSGTSTTVTLPTGPSFADISGGGTVSAPDGSQYVVGATRTSGTPTSAVLAIDSSGDPSWLTLAAPRLGASAAWISGLGLVITGGSATAAGVEVIALARSGATTGSLLAYPPDPSVGSGAAALDTSHLVLAGGVEADGSSAGVRTIDATCLASCAPMAWQPLGATLGSAQTFGIDGSSAFVVGSDSSSGLTHVYRVTSTASVEAATKVAHTNAGAVASPIGLVGSILVVGGAPAIESFAL
jgi:hypothetical protein